MSATKHILQQKWRPPVLIFILLTSIAVFFTLQIYFSAVYLDKTDNLLSTIVFQFAYLYSWGLLFILIIPFAKFYNIERSNWIKSISMHILFGIVVSLLQRVLAFCLYHCFLFQFDMIAEIISHKYFSKILYGAFDSFIIYWFVLGLYYSYNYYNQYRQNKIRAAQLESQLANAHLQALKMQLNPHFLFNTLHSISSLMAEDVKSARQTLTQLSFLLRQTIDSFGIQKITLQQELEFIVNYLKIEQTRFQKRLRVEYEIDQDTKNALVPNLILQPLVENSIRHGISPNTEGGAITLISFIEQNKLILQVVNTGIKKTAGRDVEVSRGLGLSNVEKRLNQMYGNNYAFEYHFLGAGGFFVSINIPLEY